MDQKNETRKDRNTLNSNHDEPSIFKKARITMEDQWVPAILTSIIIGIVSAVSGIVPFGQLIIMGPLYLGAAIWSLKYVRNEPYDYENIFDGFKHFGNALATGLLMMLIVFGCFLLLIIPGIIAALALSQTFFILAENPHMTPTEVLRKSRDMMRGHKTDLFGTYLVFFLLSLACILTLGIGFFFLIPYTRTVLTHFYLELKGDEGTEEEQQNHLIEDDGV